MGAYGRALAQVSGSNSKQISTCQRVSALRGRSLPVYPCSPAVSLVRRACPLGRRARSGHARPRQATSREAAPQSSQPVPDNCRLGRYAHLHHRPAEEDSTVRTADSELTEPEQRLWTAIHTGTLVDLRSGTPALDNPATGHSGAPNAACAPRYSPTCSPTPTPTSPAAP